MFNNRTLQMKLIKDSKATTTEEPTIPSTDYLQKVEYIAETVMFGIFATAVGYVAFDTIRQVAVKLTPTR